MYLNLFEGYEAYGNIEFTKFTLSNRCGNLLIEILNNYENIKEKLNYSVQQVMNSKTTEKELDYLEAFEYFPKINDKLAFFFDTVLYEFNHLSSKFFQEKKLLNEYKKNTSGSNEINKDALKSVNYLLKDYSFDKLINIQHKYLTTLIYDLDLLYNFVNNYNLQSNYNIKSFEIPRAIVSMAYKEDNIIKLYNVELINKQLKFGYLISYKIEKCSDLFNIYKSLIISKKICVKKCKNCNNYFITENRTDEVYCNRISPQDPRKTCKQYGAKRTYRQQIKEKPIDLAHSQISQVLRMRFIRSKDEEQKNFYKNMLDNYLKQFKIKKENYKAGKLTKDELYRWIVEQKEGVKNVSSRNRKK